MSQDNPEHRARQLVAELELISHAPAVNLEPTIGHDATRHPGGNRPPGGIDRWREGGDNDPDFALKSHDHFRRRINRCHTDTGFERIAADAEQALKAWKHPQHPPTDSKPWQEKLAKENGSIRDIAERWNLSPARVHQIKQQHRAA